MQKEINRLVRRIKAETLRNNHKECIELYNIVGGLYTDIGSYDEAIYNHKQALSLSKTIGDRLNAAVAFRYIGEAKAAIGNFDEAIEDIKKYLELAQKCNDRVEIQRAWTTLGRVHLMQAQDMKDNSNYVDDKILEIAHEAEKRFRTALNLAESVREQIEPKEFAQMNSGLLINIGLVKEICGEHTEAILRFSRAIEICKASKLKEELYRCQILLASIHRQRWPKDIKLAVRASQEALETAKQVGKKLLICDALIERGFVYIYQKDFKQAKRAFAQAYLEKSPNEEDHAKAIRLTKLAHLINSAYEDLCKDDTATETTMKLADRLGDLFVAVGTYRVAIGFYKRALIDAQKNGKSKSEMAKMVYSMAETYADDGQFENALFCYEKELVYRNGNDKEQCQSLVKISHMHEYLRHEPDVVCKSYEKALEKAGKNTKLLYSVLKYYVPYMKSKSFNRSRCEELETTLTNLKSYPEVIEEMEEENQEEAQDLEDEIANIDDVITDDEDGDEVMMIGRRKRKGASKFKQNEVGDTPLHEACIKGDLKRVKSLISQGHEVNPRDNAGWIPLHEACNHGHYSIVEHLIENGADVCNRGLKGMTPLHDAATNGHFSIMRLLIKNGANVIALTDSGETVLSCLRDYKQRNYSDMSNDDLSEYKQMEMELLNLMDKCGFNLMEEKARKSSNSRSISVASSSSSTHQASSIRAKPRNDIRLNTLEAQGSSVRDYRDAISTLKRKRLLDDEQEKRVKKSSLPSTYNTDSNPSVSTKEWLIDDVSRVKQTMNRRCRLRELLEEEDSFSDDEPEIVPTKPIELLKEADSLSDDEPEIVPTKPSVLFEEQEMDEIFSSDGEVKIVPTKANLTNEPLVVHIENKKLVIPIKDKRATIGWLKDTIKERYSVMVEDDSAKPDITISSIKDSSCVYYDGDYCFDVLKDDVRAYIKSWQLEPIGEAYAKACAKFNVEMLDFIKSELPKLATEDGSNKLDLSYTRFTREQVRPLTFVLARRNFVSVNLNGVSCLFDGQDDGRFLLDSIITLSNLTQLEMKCVGLRRLHFGIICKTLRLEYLKRLDLSVNLIAFKSSSEEFKKNIESLLGLCPKLTQLDMRKNYLQFVNSIEGFSDSGSFCNLSKLLDISSKSSESLTIMANEQNSSSVYLADSN